MALKQIKLPDNTVVDINDNRIAVNSPQDGQVFKYNSTTGKFENANESGGITTLTSPVRIWDLDVGQYFLPDSCVVYYSGASGTNSFTIGCGGILNVWWEYPGNNVKGYNILTSNGTSSTGMSPSFYICGYTNATYGMSTSIELTPKSTSNYGNTIFGIRGYLNITDLSNYSSYLINNGKSQGYVSSNTTHLPVSLSISSNTYCLMEVINVASDTGTTASYNQLRQDLYLPSLQKHYYRICNYNNSTVTPDTTVPGCDTNGWVEVYETYPMFAHTANTTVSGSTTTVTFAANQRCSAMLTISADLGLTIDCDNKSDNYLWIKNTGSAEVDVTISGVTANGTAVSNVYMPSDGITVPAGGLCEIGVIVNSDGAFITSRNDLTL